MVIYTMVSKSNTKIVAAMAVLAMMLAGFGVFMATDDNDAADDVQLVVTINYGGVLDADIATLMNGPADGREEWNCAYQTTLVPDYESKITILNYETFKALRDNGVIKGTFVVFDPTYLETGCYGVSPADFIDFLRTFTDVKLNATFDEIVDGVDSLVTYTPEGVFLPAASAKPTVSVVSSADAAVAIMAAVAAVEEFYADYKSPEEFMAAIQEVEDFYADYMSPEEVQEAIREAIADLSDYIYTQEDMDKAIEEVVAGYADYKSPKEVQEIVDKAIEDYKAANPVKTDDTYLYCFIVALAIAVIFAGLFAYFMFIKPKYIGAGRP